MPPNEYSRDWYDLFLATIPRQQTQREINFLTRQLPPAAYRTILDVCCGEGRHANLLARCGYIVTGIDTNADALAHARQAGTTSTYIRADMRELNALYGTFDAVLNLWASFGYFDAETNAHVLEQMSNKLNPCGRLILDIYNRDFFQIHQALRKFSQITRDGNEIAVTDEKFVRGNRLFTKLDYKDGRGDAWEWQIFTPDEISALAGQFDLIETLRCANFDEAQLPSREIPRMQFVFEK